MHQLDCQSSDQWRLPGRLGDYGITGGQRRRYQAGEDREREIPRRNARDDAAAVQSELILLTGWPRKGKRFGELATGFGCVEPQEIDRLAHFEHRIDQGLPAFTNAQREEFFRMRLVEISRTFEQPRSRLPARRIPADLCRVSGAGHAINLRGRRFERRSDSDPMVMRRHDRPALAPPNARLGSPLARFERLEPLKQWLAHQRVAEVDPG